MSIADELTFDGLAAAAGYTHATVVVLFAGDLDR